MVRNECFKAAYDYLCQSGLIADQQELAALTGITETTISRIFNNKVRQPSEETLRKLNAAFGGIFNLDYFRGKPTHMLVKDAAYYRQHPDEDVFSPSYIPYASREEKPQLKEEATSLIELAAKLIKEVEGLRRQLNDEIHEVATLRNELRSMLKTSNYQIHTPAGAYLTAAEPNE